MSIFDEKDTGGIEETLRALRTRADVASALAFLEETEPETLALQKELTLIEAPTFCEEMRGQRLLTLWKGFGLSGVTKDALGNVYGLLPGKRAGAQTVGTGKGCIVIEAHMDTVFPFGTVKEVKEDGAVLRAPGISDNTRGLALLCSLMRCFQEKNIRTERSIVFLATVREEGLGGFGGLKHFLDEHPDIEACVTVDGPDPDYVIYGGPGIQNWKLHFTGEGGHAYKHYGVVGNPVHAAVRAMDRLVELELPKEPRTCLEITGFHAGTSEGIGAIPSSAELNLNFRSAGAQQLHALADAVMRAVDTGVQEENAFVGHESVHCTVEVTADIPVSVQSRESYLVRSMSAVIRSLSLVPVLDGACPTNASMTIGRGLPGICIGGGGRAGQNHSSGEWFDTTDSFLGVQAAFLELLMIAEG